MSHQQSSLPRLYKDRSNVTENYQQAHNRLIIDNQRAIICQLLANNESGNFLK